MKRFGTDFTNDMFWVVLGFITLIIAGIVLVMLGDNTAAWLVSNLGTVLVLAFAGLCIAIGKPRWVSSDWLVDRVVNHRMRKEERAQAK